MLAVESAFAEAPLGRDALAIAVDLATIATGVVIAFAGALALLLQRSRFIRETSPDVRVVDVELLQDMSARGASAEFRVFNVKLRNESGVRAEQIHLWVNRQNWPAPTQEEVDALQPRIVGLYESRLLAEIIPHDETIVQLGVALSTSDMIGARITFELSYRSECAFILAILLPSRGRLRFSRSRAAFLSADAEAGLLSLDLL